jgi:hypothetical protein
MRYVIDLEPSELRYKMLHAQRHLLWRTRRACSMLSDGVDSRNGDRGMDRDIQHACQILRHAKSYVTNRSLPTGRADRSRHAARMATACPSISTRPATASTSRGACVELGCVTLIRATESPRSIAGPGSSSVCWSWLGFLPGALDRERGWQKAVPACHRHCQSSIIPAPAERAAERQITLSLSIDLHRAPRRV